MHVPPTSYVAAFDTLRQATRSRTTCRLVVFVACLDVDALCGAKILAGILKREMVPHRVSPVTGYAELRARCTELDDDVSTIVMIGCGALVDLSTYLEDEQREDEGEDEEEDEEELERRRMKQRRKIYVFDSHRPWNLQNLFGSENIVCFDDGDVGDGLLEAERQAFQTLLELGPDESSDEEEGSDEEDKDSDDEQEIEDETQESNDTAEAENSSPSSKRKSPSSPRSPSPSARRQKSVKQLRQEVEDVVGAYYSKGAMFSTPVASQVYTLLSFLGDTSIHDLWLSIVGTTALDRHAPQLYRRLFPLLRDEVARLNPHTNLKLSADDNTLITQPDYRIFLLRHWTLYDALIHSPYVSARLELWTDDGKKRLHHMLAKMGVPLTVARERWTHADMVLKRELRSRLQSVAEGYNIGNVVRTGVTRKFGFRGAVTAGDAVEAVAALLESGRGQTAIDKENVNPDKTEEDEKENVGTQEWVDNFWCGWDALDDVELLLHGIDRARMIQKAVVRTGSALLDKDAVKQLRPFRLAMLRDGPDLEIFSNPVTLTRLATWVSECKSEQTDKQSALVIGALDSKRDTYTIVGLPARVRPRNRTEDEDEEDEEEDDEEVLRNSFGIAFQQVAQETNARVKIDCFESSVVEIKRDDLTGFLEGMSMVDIR
ncbi:CDC45 family [Lipomyces arxii]|uniref:CDC45 family n=1 Tax=Lipomyces arxii TaxID=56418 RepID=UPI0034CED07C